MDSCYTGDYNPRDHLHSDITTCNKEELQQKYALEQGAKEHFDVWVGGWGSEGSKT